MACCKHHGYRMTFACIVFEILYVKCIINGQSIYGRIRSKQIDKTENKAFKSI